MRARLIDFVATMDIVLFFAVPLTLMIGDFARAKARPRRRD
jgi:hypothetical protein